MLSTTLQLQSSATLGTGKASTHQEALDRLEDKEVRRVIDGRAARGKRKRQQLPFSQVEDSDDAEDEDELIDMDVDGEPEHAPREQEGYSRANPVVVVDSGFSTTTLLPEPLEHSGPKVTIIGGALKRHEDGSVVAPKIVKRKPKRAKVISIFASALQRFDMSHSQLCSLASCHGQFQQGLPNPK